MLTTETIAGIRRITINRPDRRNALGTELMSMLRKELEAADRDGTSAIVLTGAAPCFCAGSDLKELGSLDVPGMAAHEAETAAVARYIGMIDCPVIAAVEGYALGGGFILAASCDLVVTAETARWRLPEVANGWLPPWGLTALERRTGPVVARRLIWGIDDVDGSAALALGIADYCVADGASLDHATQLAGKLSELPRSAVRSTKRYLRSAVMSGAELDDERAGHAFQNDCRDEAAMRTLSRFAKKQD